jgi:hypothetical protein
MTKTPTPEASTTFDPFAAENFAAAASITGDVGVVKVMIGLEVRKPHKLEWIRAHPGEEFSLRASVIEDKDNRATYLVVDSVAKLVPALVVLKDLTLCVDRSGNCFYWPVPVVAQGATENRWHTSARMALAVARKSWTRVASNMRTQSYDIAIAPAISAEPAWPIDKTRSELLKLAFGTDHVISDPSNPFIRLLMGLD